MDVVGRALREHPLGVLLYAGLAAYMTVQLTGLLRTVWRVSRSPKDRWAAAVLTGVLALAFCGLFAFLFRSLFG